MPGLIESLQAQYAALPMELREAQSLLSARESAMAALQAAGMPGPRSEAWKYTSLRALARREFASSQRPLANEAAIARLAEIPAPRMVFINGRYSATLSRLDTLPEGVELRPLSDALRGDDARAVNFLARRFERDDELFARANAALADDGVMLRVAADVVVEPIVHLVLIGQAEAVDVAWHLRSLIELRENASLQVVQHYLGAEPQRNLSTAIDHVHLKPGSRLLQLRVQDEAAGSYQFLRTDAVLGASAQYRRLDLELGGGLCRHELNIALHGKQARAQADGVLLAQGQAHIETRLGIDHAVGESECSLTWRGLGRDQGRVAFHGGITIRAGADGSDAMLSNKNLLLSEDAEINTQPVLEIHADEVKAAHGATVGRLDTNALFYLRSRGLPLPQAQRLLTAAFCHELLAGAGDESIRSLLALHLDRALARAEQS